MLSLLAAIENMLLLYMICRTYYQALSTHGFVNASIAVTRKHIIEITDYANIFQFGIYNYKNLLEMVSLFLQH